MAQSFCNLVSIGSAVETDTPVLDRITIVTRGFRPLADRENGNDRSGGSGLAVMDIVASDGEIKVKVVI